ncbi:ATP-binding cassette domain-containing protein [Brevibacillus agri]|uniref:ATP-binding cassette domain-containing protein n=1 Tax=Brevibacillus agri TaxID=51101 RepID=UPI002367D9E6|nr:ATP-binding cassette domain-containing protein [Brevibacillus agri]
MEAQKQERDMLRQKELLQVSGLYKTYEGKSSGKQAAPVINGASFSIQANETVGLVGSSGAGKSTIGRIIAGIEQADKGQLIYQGQDLLSMKPKARREATRSTR